MALTGTELKRQSTEPAVSVVIVSDYASGDDAGWNELRETLRALALQDFKEPTDIIMVESDELVGRIPHDLGTILPALRVVAVPKRTSYELKNAAVEAASTELVAMLDGDCAPAPDWLRLMVDAARSHPEAAVISGKTVHSGNSLIHRAMGAVNRSFPDIGRFGPTRRISNNNALYRRSAFMAHPLPTNAGPFASHMQAESIRRAGGHLLFEPGARVVHAYEGWATERNFRRSNGFGVIRTRQLDPRIPYGWLTRLGYLSIPVFVGGHILTAWWYCIRRGRDHGLAWYELPVAFAFSAAAISLETPGMLSALRNEAGVDTLFR